MPRRPSSTWATLVLIAGCGSADLRTLDLSGEDGVGFVVQTSAEQPWRVVNGPFGLDQGELTFGTRPQLTLEQETEGLVVLVRHEDIAAAVPGWSASDGPQLDLELDAQPQASLRADEWIIETVPLPAAARLWRTEAGAVTEVTDAPDRLWLSVPFDPEHCRPQAPDRMRTWGDVAPLDALRSTNISLHLRNVAMLDRDALLAQSTDAVFALQRGQTLGLDDLRTAPPHRVLTVTELVPESRFVRIEHVAVDPRPGAPRAALVLSARLDDARPEDGFISYVHQLEVSEAGMTVVRTATVVRGVRLRETAIDDTGAFAIAGDNQVVLFGHLDSPPLRRGPAPPGPSEETRSIAAQPDPMRPWVMSGERALFTYDASQTRWVGQMLEEVIAETVHFRGLATGRVQGEVQAWAGGPNGRLYATDSGGTWQRIPLQLPPRMNACTQEQRVRPANTLDVEDMAIEGEQLFIASDNCAFILQVRLTDRCTSGLALGDRPVQSGNDVAQGLDTKDGLLVVVADEGQIWEAPTR